MRATAYKKQLLRKTFLSGMLNHLHPKIFNDISKPEKHSIFGGVR